MFDYLFSTKVCEISRAKMGRAESKIYGSYLFQTAICIFAIRSKLETRDAEAVEAANFCGSGSWKR